MGAALAEHEAVIAEVVAAHGGRLIKTQGGGDSTLSVFARASDAVAAAVALQQALDRRRWPAGIALPTRAALHTGEAELRDHDYFGQALNRAARLRALGRGGQVLLSRATAELVADQLPDGAELRAALDRALGGRATWGRTTSPSARPSPPRWRGWPRPPGIGVTALGAAGSSWPTSWRRATSAPWRSAWSATAARAS